MIDPTENVISLTEAANKRQDDLREMNNSRIDAELKHLSEMASLRAEHQKEIAVLESTRLNAIRQVDVLAVNTAADRAAAAIQALASTTASNAENLRNALTTTATAIATQTAGSFSAITERVAALEKSSYEGKGKERMADPMMAEMLAEMKSLRESRASVVGKSEGVSASWVLLIGVVVLISTLLGIAGMIFAFVKR